MTDAVIDLKFLVDDSDLDKAVRKTKNFENKIKRLAQAEAQGKITKDQYTNSVKQMASELQKLSGGTITARNSIFKYSQAVYKASKSVEENTKDVTQNTAAVNTQGKVYQKTSRAINQYGDRTGLAGKRTNRMGMQLQQAGYQVGDFFVQIQSGTNAMVAFGQQATQLLGVFGTAGALAGAGLAITTALLAPLMRGEKEASKLVDRIKELRQELDDLQGNQVMPDEAIAAFKILEELDVRRLELNEKLARAQEVALQFAERGGLTQQNALAEVYRLEQELVNLEEERSKISEQTLGYQELLSQKKREIANQESTSLNREIALLLTKIEFGEESAAVKELEKEHALAAYEEELRRLHLAPQVTQALLEQKSIALGLAIELGNAADEYGRIVSAGEGRTWEQEQRRLYGQGMEYFNRRRGTFKTRTTKTRGGGSGKSEATKIQDTVDKLQKQLKLEEQLLGVSDERARILKALGSEYVESNPKIVAGLEEQILKIEELKELEEQRKQIIDGVESSMETALMSMVEGTKSVKDAFRDMARDIISELYRILVVEQMVNSVSGALFGGLGGGTTGTLGSLFGSSGGGRLKLFDGGGYTGNGARSGGLDGKGGFLAMMHPQETVIDHTKGQTMGETVVINQNFNLSANGDESVKKLIAEAAPVIAGMAKQEVLNSRRRGGAMKNAFG